MFILAGERSRDIVGSFERYRAYLDANAERFPPNALELARSDWWFSGADHQAPHDGWLMSFRLDEPAQGERHEIRSVSIEFTLLCAYHDHLLHVRYPVVHAYDLSASGVVNGHRDWRYDEFRVDDQGRLVHEIEWASGVSARDPHWLIVADDIEIRSDAIDS